MPRYWNELKHLSNDEKLQIIMFLSSSMIHPHNNIQVSPDKYTKEMLDHFSGAWVGEESAEDIISNINESKKSHTEPVSLP